MKVAYADPPYLGCARKHYKHDPRHGIYDTLEGHEALIRRLVNEYPDGWALSCTSGNLQCLLPLCPKSGVRVAAWTKPFASFKPNVNPGYCWEPVIWCGGRQPRGRTEPTVRDYCAVNITLKKGLTGAKPEAFCTWLFSLLGLQEGDEFHDLFPGTGGVQRAWDSYVVSTRPINAAP